MKRVLSLIAGIALAAAPLAQADEPLTDSEQRQPSALRSFAIVEGLFLVNAGLAAASPKVFGGLGLLISPLGAGAPRGFKTGAADYVAMTMFVGLCVFNLTVPGDEGYEEDETFVANVVGWHAFAGALLLTERWFPREKIDAAAQLGPWLVDDAAGVRYTRRF